MTDIQERLEHYEAQDRERRKLADEIKDRDLNLFRLARDKNEPDEEFRAAYIQQGQLLRQYREKYGQKAEEQLRDQLDELRSAYVKRYEAEEQPERQKGRAKMTEQEREELKRQIQLYRGALRFYRDQLNEARDVAGILSYVIDMFTDRHPEYAEEILALIDISKDDLEED